MAEDELIHGLQEKALRIRRNILAMIGTGMAGHLGGSSSLAEIMAVLYFHILRLDPRNLRDDRRDRFLLSKGHAVLAQYAALVELGVIPREELAKVKTIEGMLQGHPDMERTPGIEAVTGSLGQGLSIANGMALGLRLDRNPARVYVVLGDGELSEGQVWEAAMASACYKIDSLTAILDRNGIQATGPTKDVFDIPCISQKWAAFGWECIEVDGHDIRALIGALESAVRVKGRPTIVIAATVKGKGFSFAENTAAFHNAVLTEAQYATALSDLDKEARLEGAFRGHN
ncbi:MAG: transketolase [Spirochaetia bacterium]|jgi:transketolase